MNIVKSLILSLALLLSLPIKADHEYRLIERDGHKIHVVIINPKEYEASLAVAHNQVFGRERVGEIAKRENAQIAINDDSGVSVFNKSVLPPPLKLH